MGACKSKSARQAGQKYLFDVMDEKDQKNLSWLEREQRCTWQEENLYAEIEKEVQDWPPAKRKALLEPIDLPDNMDTHRPFKKLRIPLDAEGYCEAFLLDDPQSLPAITHFFDLYGFVVIRGAISEQSCEVSRSDVWEFIKRHRFHAVRNDKSTWNNNNWPSLATLGYLGTSKILSKFLNVRF